MLTNGCDGGKIPLSAYDNLLALDQMEVAYDTLLARPVAKPDGSDLVPSKPVLGLDGAVHPKVITYALPTLSPMNYTHAHINCY